MSTSAIPTAMGVPSPAPTDIDAEETHEHDAHISLLLTVTLIVCILLSFCIKVNKLYYLPESAASILIGVVIGGIARLTVKDLTLLSFSPELFFFVLLPPIIFEAGYSLKRKNFFENFGAITLYAFFGTIISTFVVGYLTFGAAKLGVPGIDSENPMEALLFGALISAVDPVATLSIMGSPELQCNPLLYSLVFGESVLNDAIAIVLFKTFHFYYNPDSPDIESSDIPRALMSFVNVSLLSILVGIALGLLASFIYRHLVRLKEHPTIETALLFLFCYCCYATAEALQLSGIMALFFNGVVLSHYNTYNLSDTAHVAADHIFATLAVLSETMVFLYMGMGVFAGKLHSWNIIFAFLALLFCIIGRALNIFPLSFLANMCRGERNTIPVNMQSVLWFAGLRGAIAFALSENMPGKNKETYISATLTICIFTTVVCGGFTNRMLDQMGMKQTHSIDSPTAANAGRMDSDGYMYNQLIESSEHLQELDTRVRSGAKDAWKNFDNAYLKPTFGGSNPNSHARASRHYNDDDDDDDLDSLSLAEMESTNEVKDMDSFQESRVSQE